MTSENNKIIIHALQTAGLIPVFAHSDVDVWEQILKIAYRCGVRVFEFTHLRDARGIRLFSHLNEVAAQYPELILGAGTVLDAATADRYLKSGARFIASPFLREDMAEICSWHNALWIPGCSTAPEIAQAAELGAEVISILPGNTTGADHMKVAARNHTGIHFIPSTGVAVREENLYEWIHAGALSIRMGSSLFPKDTIAIKDWMRVERNISGALTAIRQAKHAQTVRPNSQVTI